MHHSRSSTPQLSEPHRCAFCGYGLPEHPVDGTSGLCFCSERCRRAYENGDEPFANRFEFRQFFTGVSALDTLLPWGMPANSFVLLAGRGGIRHRGLQTELVWRALERGEPGVMISFVDPPLAVIEHFLSFGWNVLPHLESDDLHIIDCFTNRLREEHRSPDHQVAWNEYLQGFLDESVTVVRDTTDFRSIESTLHEQLRAKEMLGSGLVTLDSLNEVELQGHEFAAEGFLKEIRGDICTRNFVPIFASTTITEDEGFAEEHAYLFDGIVDMQRTEAVIPGLRLKELSIRKMDGTRYLPDWAAYEISPRGGFRLFDPRTEINTIYGGRSGVSTTASPPPPRPVERSQPANAAPGQNRTPQRSDVDTSPKTH